jgi:hypothetical protein
LSPKNVWQRQIWFSWFIHPEINQISGQILLKCLKNMNDKIHFGNAVLRLFTFIPSTTLHLPKERKNIESTKMDNLFLAFSM